MENISSGKEIVLQLLNHIGDQEKHFNGLETQYRLLASTWLLACFGGIGFLLQSEKKIVIEPWILTGFIGLIGSIGIYLLWIMDIKVYHKLLHCVFIEGIKLEQKHDWLPKMRTEMLISQETGEVTASTGLYYICSISILLVVSIMAFSMYFTATAVRALICLIGLVVLGIVYRHMSQSSINQAAIALREELISQNR